ncbi:uncharacterized protein PFL1_05554 [Pseudozyma flocculosa PF-1]|uniref:Related to neutral amino acid permease n=2 Tax=Pseudozyma flocculosa TaxID=84751 RepID=A0A5C3F9T3_9BASI|nr:uncharacterized protein PFL1_05554 [Pseudozyma flocculosa PF-1]EPQ26919.1 hypothetical protein PFL1_05554 [Pseudozyma flocculosa PF-1]SPO41174.1 related to neutral amino acid permease [Pseudozyma flocculosa]
MPSSNPDLHHVNPTMETSAHLGDDDQQRLDTAASHSSRSDDLEKGGLEEAKPVKDKDDVEALGAAHAHVKRVSDDSSSLAAAVQDVQTSGEINYRTLSWQKAAALLFGEYVCLAILSFPWAFSILGMAGGIMATLGVGVCALYTGLTLHKYCLKYPQALNICDIGYQIFGKSRIAYEITALSLILNNVFIQGLHTLTGSQILNTLSEHGTCTLAFSIIIMVVCLLLTLPRKLEQVAMMGIVSAISMAISIFLVLIFTGIQGRNPAVADVTAPVRITAFAPEGTTFVDGFNAFLNIVFTWIGHICYPTFIAEMKEPKDFDKALYAVTAMEFIVFTLVGIVAYYYTGQYTTAPAVGTLKPIFKKIAFAFVLPTTIIIGVIYASVVAKYLHARLFLGTKHYNNNTTVGWIGWVGCVTFTWVLGWVIGEAIPFFSTLLSLMSALFDSYIGYIFWAVAYVELHRGHLWTGQRWTRKLETAFQGFLIIVGLFIFGPGLYSSIQAIITNYDTGSVKAPFTCVDNAL